MAGNNPTLVTYQALHLGACGKKCTYLAVTEVANDPQLQDFNDLSTLQTSLTGASQAYCSLNILISYQKFFWKAEKARRPEMSGSFLHRQWRFCLPCTQDECSSLFLWHAKAA